MYRSAGLLILLAFALGLWIGFNPEAHAGAERSWAEVKVAFADLEVRFKESTGHLFKNTDTPPPAKPPETPNVGNQVEAALKQFAAALERLWDQFVARVRSV